MRYQLGPIPLLPDYDAYFAALRRTRHARPDPRRLLAALERIELAQRSGLPDLLAALPGRDPDHGWVAEAAKTLADEHARSRRIGLLRCEREPGQDGFVAIVVIDRTRRTQVRPNDLLVGGVALVRDRQGSVAVHPRIYRQVCSNGAVTYSHTAASCLAQSGSVRAAIRACLAPAATETAFARLRAAATARVEDPLELLARARLPVEPVAVLEAQEERDDTVYGMVNALTALARNEPRWPRRLEIERGAERILDAAELLVRRPARALAVPRRELHGACS